MKIIEFCSNSLNRCSTKEALLSAGAMMLGLTLLVTGIILSLQIFPTGIALLGVGGGCVLISLISILIVCVRRHRAKLRDLEALGKVVKNPVLEGIEASYQNFHGIYAHWLNRLPGFEEEHQQLVEDEQRTAEEIEELERGIQQATFEKKTIDEEVSSDSKKLEAMRAPGWTGWVKGFWDPKAAEVPIPIDLSEPSEIDMGSLTDEEKNLIDQLIVLRKQQQEYEVRITELCRSAKIKKALLDETRKKKHVLDNKITRLRIYLFTVSNYLLDLHSFIQNPEKITTTEAFVPEAPSLFQEEISEEVEEIEAVKSLPFIDCARLENEIVFDPNSLVVQKFATGFQEWLAKDFVSIRSFLGSFCKKDVHPVIKIKGAVSEFTTNNSFFKPLKRLQKLAQLVNYRTILCLISTNASIKAAVKEAVCSLYHSTDDALMFIMIMNFINNLFTAAQVKQPFSQLEAESFCQFLGVSVERYNEVVQKGDFLTLILKDICGVFPEQNETRDTRELAGFLQSPTDKPSLMEGLRLASMKEFIRLYGVHLNQYQNYGTPSCEVDMENITPIFNSKTGIITIVRDLIYYQTHQKSKLFTTHGEYPLSFLKVVSNSTKYQKAMRKGLGWIPLPGDMVVSIADTFLCLCFHYGAFEHQEGRLKEMFYADICKRINRKNVDYSIQNMSFLRLVAPDFYASVQPKK